MNRWKRTVSATILIVALTATSFVAGYGFDHFALLGRALSGGTRHILALANPTAGGEAVELNVGPLTAFWEVLQFVRADYVEPVKDDRALTYGAIRGMLAGLDDPYTRFLSPEDYRQFSTETHGEFGGIGAVLGMKRDESGKREIITVVEVIEGGPASRAGIQEGDAILGVDGKSMAGMSLEDAVRMIRGPKGTTVKLTLGRKGIEEPLEVSIVRETVEVPVVEHKMLDDKVGYLALKQFNDLTASKTDEALQDLDREGMKALIIDVRNNPGGLLSSVLDVASSFVNEGPIVFTKQRRGGVEPKMPETRRYRGYDLPLVVIVNGMSASGSEILAAALKDYGLAKLVGTTTFGKALVQSVYPLSDGSAVVITTAKYLTPKGEDINKKGVVPDEVVEGEQKVSRKLMSPQELEDAVGGLEKFTEGAGQGREQAKEDLEKIRRALGLVSRPKEQQTDVQLQAAEKIVEDELAQRGSLGVAAAAH